jgi:anti-sigma regulatory factor (Ser/Thr protein kinase)
VSAPDPIVLDLPSEASVLSLVRAALRAVAEDTRRVRLEPREVDEVEVALQEACTNVIRHAHGGDSSKRLVVEILRREDALEILVRDSGPAFVLESKRRDAQDELAEGGYGITIMRSWMDEVSLTREGPGNVLRLVRRYKAGVGGERVAAR